MLGSTMKREVLMRHWLWLDGKPSWCAFGPLASPIYWVMSYYWTRSV